MNFETLKFVTDDKQLLLYNHFSLGQMTFLFFLLTSKMSLHYYMYTHEIVTGRHANRPCIKIERRNFIYDCVNDDTLKNETTIMMMMMIMIIMIPLILHCRVLGQRRNSAYVQIARVTMAPSFVLATI